MAVSKLVETAHSVEKQNGQGNFVNLDEGSFSSRLLAFTKKSICLLLSLHC